MASETRARLEALSAKILILSEIAETEHEREVWSRYHKDIDGVLEEFKNLRVLAGAVGDWYDSSHKDITDALDVWEEARSS